MNNPLLPTEPRLSSETSTILRLPPHQQNVSFLEVSYVILRQGYKHTLNFFRLQIFYLYSLKGNVFFFLFPFKDRQNVTGIVAFSLFVDVWFLFLDFINTQETSNIIDQLVATLSSDSSEVACEKECHILITDSTSVFQHMCPFLCHS